MPTALAQLSAQRLLIRAKLLTRDSRIWDALIMFLATLVLLTAVPFYPVWLVFLLALACAALTLWNGTAAMLFNAVLGFFAFAYQSPVLGWLAIIPLFFVLISMFSAWRLLALLELLIFVHFSPFPLNLLALFFPFIILCACAFYGSKEVLAIVAGSLLMIFTLSVIWHKPTILFPVGSHDVKGISSLQLNSQPVSILALPDAMVRSILRMFGGAGGSLASASKGLEGAFDLIIQLCFSDSGLVQILAWIMALLLALAVSLKVRSHFAQTISSLALFLLIPLYAAVSLFFHEPFPVGLLFSIAVSVVAMLVLDITGINLNRERELRTKEKLGAIAEMGVEDLSLVAKEKGLDDVGNYEDVKKELYNAIILPLQDPVLAEQYHIKPAKGILLFGPPGCGKTMLMRALAKELHYTFLYVKTSSILSKWVGESEKNVSLLFKKAREMKPCIIFFDEIDSLGRKRGEVSQDEVGLRILSTLLQEMDGINSQRDGVIVVGATNAPHLIDPALLRPGRLDKIIYMPLPDLKGRKEIFKVVLRPYPKKDIDYDLLAAKTPRFSGADIKAVVEETARLVAERAKKENRLIPITTQDLLDVISKTKPSVRLADLEMYERFKLDFERKRGMHEKKEKAVRWEDVVGLDRVKQAILDAIQLPLLHEDLLKKYKVKPYKGILLFGPPGCGKTLLAKAAASELKATFIYVSPTDILSDYVHSAERLKEIFNRAKENAPAIVFIDEIETLFPARSFGLNERIGEFLTLLDGVKDMKGVLVLGATNEPEYLDPAVLRPGRFDKIFYVPPPDKEGRVKLFELYLGDFAKNVDLERLAEETEGFTGADIASICETVKMEAVKKMVKGEKAEISTEDVLKVVRSRHPSVTPQLLAKYQRFIQEYGERT